MQSILRSPRLAIIYAVVVWGALCHRGLQAQTMIDVINNTPDVIRVTPLYRTQGSGQEYRDFPAKSSEQAFKAREVTPYLLIQVNPTSATPKNIFFQYWWGAVNRNPGVPERISLLFNRINGQLYIKSRMTGGSFVTKAVDQVAPYLAQGIETSGLAISAPDNQYSIDIPGNYIHKLASLGLTKPD